MENDRWGPLESGEATGRVRKGEREGKRGGGKGRGGGEKGSC